MFSGKSEELIRRLRRARIARQKVQVFKPEIDARFSNNHIVSHSEMKHESFNVRTAEEIRANVLPDTEVVGIDEGQFFDNDLIAIANELAERGVRGDHCGIGSGLHRQTLGAHAAATCGCRIHHQDARHLHEVRPACELHPTHLLNLKNAWPSAAPACTKRVVAPAFVPHADAPTRPW